MPRAAQQFFAAQHFLLKIHVAIGRFGCQNLIGLPCD
jgi:hypothetical protein